MEQMQTGFSPSLKVTQNGYPVAEGQSDPAEGTRPFSTYLKEKADLRDAGELKFSKHAAKRLDDRNISLSESQNRRLSEGVARAEEKGINDSLVMVDSMAFIVNVPSQTVVTALDQKEAGDHIYTNIDGAVIA